MTAPAIIPDPSAAAQFMQACREVLARAGARWVDLAGPYEDRLAAAIAAIEALPPP